ncbi:hypothetical protein [Absidia glauca]|uniref:ATP-dependent DNA helicase n=1 Tax=Absidia glauca TaxID=4829 RepID=A0A163KZB8_ABSGL|nr:hypothetical protein [Absidia glauca]
MDTTLSTADNIDKKLTIQALYEPPGSQLFFVPKTPPSNPRSHLHKIDLDLSDTYTQWHPVIEQLIDTRFQPTGNGRLLIHKMLLHWTIPTETTTAPPIPIFTASPKTLRMYWQKNVRSRPEVKPHYAAPRYIAMSPDQWSVFWSLTIPHRVRNLWWRLLLHKLPTRLRLVKFKIPQVTTPTCAICQETPEDDHHMVIGCPLKEDLWHRALAQQPVPSVTHALNAQSPDSDYISHFRGRQYGIIEAVYDIFGWHKEGSSKEVIMLNTNMPDNQRFTIKRKAHMDPSRPDDLTYDTHLDKYLKRPTSAEELTLVQFFTNFRQLYNAHSRDVHFSTDGTRWAKRRSPCLWRTRFLVPSSGEPFYYQRILLNVPFRSTDQVFNLQINGTYKGCHDALVRDSVLPPLENMTTEQEVLARYTVSTEEGRGLNANDQDLATPGLASRTIQSRITSFTPSQYRSYTNTLETIDQHCPVLIHGGAGTGKSFLLSTIDMHYTSIGYIVIKLAFTGVAAHNINGSTIHRFFGLDNVEGLPNHIRLDKFLKDNPRVIFLIDEISMVSGELLNKISNALCLAKRSSTAFGGLPTIFFGDLAQLLPFSSDGSPVSLPMSSTIFSSLSVQHVYHPCRQTDVQFFKVLSMIRQNKLDNSLVIDAPSSRIATTRQSHPDSTVLIAYKVGAEEFNAEKLALVPGDVVVYRSIDERGGMGSTADEALTNTALPKALHLKIGARVMMLHNYDVEGGWVNGTLCTVLSMETDTIIVCKVDHPDSIFPVTGITRTVPMSSYSRCQFPLTLGWALTIHKVQGLTLDKVSLYLSSFFAPGLLYVALTRVRRLEDLTFILSDVIDISNIKVPYNEDCLKWITQFENHIASISS